MMSRETRSWIGLCFIIIVCTLFITGIIAAFGNSQEDVELIGQIKEIKPFNPVIFPRYKAVSVSLGVTRNGVGSFSKEDVLLYIPNDQLLNTLKVANDKGHLVKVIYDEERFNIRRSTNKDIKAVTEVVD